MAIKNKKITSLVDSAELERERLITLINSMADAVVSIDENANVILYNGAVLSIFDTNKSLIGENIEDVVTIVDKNNQKVDIKNYITGLETQKSTRDFKIRGHDGAYTNLYVSVAPIRLGYGKKGNQGFVMVFRDITREKSLEEERDEFISVVSHELRTPIAISEGDVGNALFLAEKMNADKQIINPLKQAHAQILFLSSMINDLATLSRAERGKLNVEIEKINTHDLILELEKDYKTQANDKGLTLETDIDPALELLSSSRLYVREILQNFITNAIKYTEKGKVTISAHNSPGGVMFEISDTGIGISKPDQEKVFDKFFRSEDYRTRASSGTGLGLYVTMKLARLIRAEIDIDSEVNKGSRFSIKIPNLL